MSEPAFLNLDLVKKGCGMIDQAGFPVHGPNVCEPN